MKTTLKKIKTLNEIFSGIKFDDEQNRMAAEENLKRLKPVIEDYNHWLFKLKVNKAQKDRKTGLLIRDHFGNRCYDADTEIALEEEAIEHLKTETEFEFETVQYNAEIEELPVAIQIELEGSFFSADSKKQYYVNK